MSLPNPKVLNAFIELYLNSRQKGRKPNNFVEQTLSAVSNAVHLVAGKPSDDATVQICQGLKNKFANKESAEKWIEVVLDVCDTAKKAQESKTSMLAQAGLTSPESLLCETLYAIRSYILCHLQNDADSRSVYNTFIKELTSDYEKTESKIQTTRCEYNDVSELIKKRAELVTKLAYLDYRPSVHLAIDLRCLDYLPQINHTPGNMPYCYLEQFYLRLYADKYQPETRISFEEFERKAMEVVPPALSAVSPSSSPVHLSPHGIFTPVSLHPSSSASDEESTLHKPSRSRSHQSEG